MLLPPEIRRQIASHLLHIEADPWYSQHDFDWGSQWERFENGSLLMFLDHDPELFATENAYYGNPLFRLRACLKHLLPLRRVSHEWYQTVTGLFQEHRWWLIPFELSQLERRLGGLERVPRNEPGSVSKLPLSPAQMIRNLEIRIIDYVLTFQTEYRAGLRVEEPLEEFQASCDELALGPGYDPHYTQVHYKQAEEHRVLRKIFDSVERIDAFGIYFPHAQVKGRNPSDDEFHAECYDVKAVQDMAATIGYAFNSIAFQHLADLRLKIPCTRDVALFTRSMNEDARRRLKRLYIEIMDHTGGCGEDRERLCLNYNINHVFANAVEGPSHVASSNVQMAYPNDTYQDCLWELVSSCSNLEALSIKGAHWLDLDRLVWEKSSKFAGLRYLSLHRVCTSVASLIRLVSPGSVSDGSPQLRAINICKVKICPGGGEWAQFFAFLREKCLDLQCSRTNLLVYSAAHPNYRKPKVTGLNLFPVWTTKDEDSSELKGLVQHLYHKAGGRSKYPPECYARINIDGDAYKTGEWPQFTRSRAWVRERQERRRMNPGDWDNA